ncbi:MAG: methyltransferase [Actinomycetota bacterium]
MPAFDLASLTSLVDPGARVGIGLVAGDPREREVVRHAEFCSLSVYPDAVALLEALRAGEVNSAVRGSLPSSSFLEAVRMRAPGRLRRIALLVLPGGTPFLLGPVGIDEGGNLSEARRLLSDLRVFCDLLGWEPRIAALSAGRPEDAARGGRIRSSIQRAEVLAAEDDVRAYHITIEEAFPWANCLLAPDGVTGNLIYRTLVHLGGGRSLGALYFPRRLRLADTSRSGTAEEYLGAIALAALSVKA